MTDMRMLVAVVEKARRLEAEIRQVADPVLRANLLHTHSKCFMFLADAIRDDWRAAQDIAWLECLIP